MFATFLGLGLIGCLRGDTIVATGDHPDGTEGCTLYADEDGDTYGDPTRTTCDATGVLDATDCDDSDARVHPGAPEICADGPPRDDDCSPETSDPVASIGNTPYEDLSSAVADSKPGDVIRLCDTNQTVSNIFIDHDLTIQSASGEPGNVVLDGDGSSIFVLTRAVGFTLKGLTLDGGEGFIGGAVNASIWSAAPSTVDLFGTVKLHNVAATGNQAAVGGVVAADTVEIEDSTFAESTATGQGEALPGWGGAIYANHVSIDNSEFRGGNAAEGGAVAANVDVYSYDSTYSNNRATTTGGAIMSLGPLTSDLDEFVQNTAGLGNGGAIAITTTSSITNGTLLSNSGLFGGAVFASNSEPGATAVLDVEGSTFTLNTASRRGGGLYAENLTRVEASGATFLNNQAVGLSEATGTGGGAAVEVWVDIDTLWVGGTFSNNHANLEGGGVMLNTANLDEGVIEFQGVTWSGNDAPRAAGLLLDHDSTVVLTNGSFTDNIATVEGGAVVAPTGSDLTANGTHFVSNVAPTGAALLGLGARLELNQAMVHSNMAKGDSGAVHALSIAGDAASIYVINSDLGENDTENREYDLVFMTVNRNGEQNVNIECFDIGCRTGQSAITADHAHAFDGRPSVPSR